LLYLNETKITKVKEDSNNLVENLRNKMGNSSGSFDLKKIKNHHRKAIHIRSSKRKNFDNLFLFYRPIKSKSRDTLIKKTSEIDDSKINTISIHMLNMNETTLFNSNHRLSSYERSIKVPEYDDDDVYSSLSSDKTVKFRLRNDIIEAYANYDYFNSF
jgi:hypothetical protein